MACGSMCQCEECPRVTPSTDVTHELMLDANAGRRAGAGEGSPVPGATHQVIQTLHAGSGIQVGATGRWAVTKPKGFGRGGFIHVEGKAVLSRFACYGWCRARMRT